MCEKGHEWRRLTILYTSCSGSLTHSQSHFICSNHPSGQSVESIDIGTTGEWVGNEMMLVLTHYIL